MEMEREREIERERDREREREMEMEREIERHFLTEEHVFFIFLWSQYDRNTFSPKKALTFKILRIKNNYI